MGSEHSSAISFSNLNSPVLCKTWALGFGHPYSQAGCLFYFFGANVGGLGRPELTAVTCKASPEVGDKTQKSTHPPSRRKTDSQKSRQHKRKCRLPVTPGGHQRESEGRRPPGARSTCPRGLRSSWTPGPAGTRVGRDSGLSTEPDQAPKGQRGSAARSALLGKPAWARLEGEGAKSSGTRAGVRPGCPAPWSACVSLAPDVALQDNGCPAVTLCCRGSPRPVSAARGLLPGLRRRSLPRPHPCHEHRPIT